VCGSADDALAACCWQQRAARAPALPATLTSARWWWWAQVVEFAEKPKGDALTSMKVDTTVLGVDPAT
jgi:hypothetical protein